MKAAQLDNIFFKTAVHQCNDFVIITDANAIIKYVNPAFEKHTGYRLSKIKGQNISIVKSGLHKQGFYKKLWSDLKKGEPKSSIFINKKKNGDLFYENKTITPIVSATGVIEHYLSTSKDITQEIKLQKEVMKQKDLVYSVIQNTDALILGLNLNAEIVLFNKACEKITGYKFSQVIQKAIHDILMHPLEKESFMKAFNRTVADPAKNKRFESRWLSRSGKTILISWYNTIILNNLTGQSMVLATGQDITAERASEQKLMELNQTLDEKIQKRTEALKKLNEEVVLQNRFINKINTGLPALIYLYDTGTQRVKILNHKINNKIRFPVTAGSNTPSADFLQYFVGLDKKEILPENFFFKSPSNEYQLFLNNHVLIVQNKAVPFETARNGNPRSILGFVTDITETKKIQKRYEESQKIARIGNWEWNIRSNTLFWSKETYNIFEIDEDKYKPSYTAFLDRIYPEDRLKVETAVNNALRNHQKYEIVHRLEPRPGVIKYVLEQGFPKYDLKGRPLRMMGTVQDITDRIRIQQRLEDSQRLARIGSWEWDSKRKKLIFTAELYRILGYDGEPEGLSFRRLLQQFYPEDATTLLQNVRKALKGTQPPGCIYRIYTPGGNLRYLSCKASLETSDSKSIRILGAVQDITDEKLLKNKLQSAYVTLQNSLNAVLTSDLSGKVEYANASAAQMWGFDNLEKMLENRPTIYDYWFPQELAKVHAGITAIRKGGNYYTADPFIARKKDGSQMLVRFNGALIHDDNKQPSALTYSFFDVTEEVRIKKEVEAYDAKLNLLLGNIDEVVYGVEANGTCQLDGTVFFLNEKATTLFGFGLEDLRSDPDLWRNCLHPDDKKHVIATTAEAVKQKKSVTREYRIRHAVKNEYFWFEDKLTPQFGENGDLVAYFGSARDITEKKKISDLLKKSEEKYRLISDNNRDLITMRDANFNPIFISSSVKAILGYDVEEYKKINMLDLVHPEDRESVRKIPLATTAENSKGITEERMLHKDGNYIWIQTVTQTIRDEKGKVLHIVESSRDITQRKNLEKEISDSEKKYRAIYENALVGILRTNLLTDRIVDANPACCNMFGFSSKDDMILNFIPTTSYLDENERQSMLEELKINGEVLNRHIKFRKPDNTIFWGNISMKLLPKEHIIESVVIDITESKSHEIALRKSVLEKDLLLKEVHHRVKNNLQVISSLIKLQLNKISDPEVREPLLESKERIHAIALIHEKLYLSEDLATINFSDYLSNLTRPMRALHRTKNIDVEYFLEDYYTDISVAVPLGLVCYEIISNAFKHAFNIKNKGTLSITVKKARKHVSIQIADNGDGFEISKVDTTKTLGWKLIENLVKQAKGELSTSSDMKVGSKFEIQIQP